jgi:hypothetical protein
MSASANHLERKKLMTPRRVFLPLAALLIPLACVVLLLYSAQAVAPLPTAAQRPLPAQAFAAPVQGTLPFSEVIDLVTSATFPGVMVIISSTTNADGVGIPYGATWTIDNGSTWQQFSALPASSFTIGIAARSDPEQPIRFLLAGGGTIFRTGDFGESWAVGVKSNEDMQGLYYCSWRLTNGVQPQVLYAYQSCNGRDDLSFLSARFMSEDGGATWKPMLICCDNLLPSPLIANRLYAQRENVWFQSDDNGVIWLARESFAQMDYLVLDPSEPDTMYGTDYPWGGVQRAWTSTDSGASWQDWSSKPCAGKPFFYNRWLSTGRHQLWARCEESLAWYYSPDAGDTWRLMGAADAQLLTADRGHLGHALMVNDNGLWRSVDGGEWQLVTADFAPPPPVYYLPLVSRQ